MDRNKSTQKKALLGRRGKLSGLYIVVIEDKMWPDEYLYVFEPAEFGNQVQ